MHRVWLPGQGFQRGLPSAIRQFHVPIRLLPELIRRQTGTFDGTLARPIIVASKTAQIDLAAQPAAATAYGYLKSLIQTSSEAGLPYSITYPDRRQFAPRFGLAWRPLGETTVVRGG